jgi:hypothetical protein
MGLKPPRDQNGYGPLMTGINHPNPNDQLACKLTTHLLFVADQGCPKCIHYNFRPTKPFPPVTHSKHNNNNNNNNYLISELFSSLSINFKPF